ncbi:conserved Plasmodium protein, unknown function [Plasmodium relictum]|uniref:Uncharacterized protein n=1 Tax=Plasmodium relictum TaxID=85471 RepID=A0A1J1H4L8_PLARL|nr:conserved Plasmodium protein, unknown function [Plasmodium relictum]CRG99868.1 conserved Plasmodium protein, unknown function [Plasmodium relictum]
MVINTIYSNKNFKKMILGTKETLQYKNIANLRKCKKKNEKNISYNGEKNDGFLSSKIDEKNKNVLQKHLFFKKFNENFFKKRKIFYIDNNIFFILGGFTTLYSVFVYDFFTNRHMQIFSNFFFLLFQVTRQSINILACAVHLLFICFQIYVLYIKSDVIIK